MIVAKPTVVFSSYKVNSSSGQPQEIVSRLDKLWLKRERGSSTNQKIGGSFPSCPSPRAETNAIQTQSIYLD